MDWKQYFQIQVFEVIPCPYIEGWSYYRYHILPTKDFDTEHNKGKDLGMVQGHCCQLVLKLMPMEHNHIASNLCWYGASMIPIEYIIYWLQGVLNGHPNMYYLGDTYFEYIDFYIYTVRMFYTVQAYLGNDLFKKFLYEVL